jgi:hypothetical protein
MAIDLAKPITGVVETDRPLHFELRAPWGARPPRVLVGGRRAPVDFAGGTMAFPVPAGKHQVQIRRATSQARP